MINTYKPLCQAIERLFAPYAEVVIHDLKKGKIAYLGGGFSDRKVGDPSNLDDVPLDDSKDVIGPYEKTNFDGRKLKSISVVLRQGEKAKASHMLCINFDTSVLGELSATIAAFIGRSNFDQSATMLFKEDWQERINVFVHETLKKRGKTVATATKDDKKSIVALLERQGAFRGKSATAYAAKVLKISRASIYNYLNQQK